MNKTRKINKDYNVQWFYDRSVRLWTATVHDGLGDQVGDAQYSADEHDAVIDAVSHYYLFHSPTTGQL